MVLISIVIYLVLGYILLCIVKIKTLLGKEPEVPHKVSGDISKITIL